MFTFVLNPIRAIELHAAEQSVNADMFLPVFIYNTIVRKLAKIV
jgi:hypothetical protein